VATGDNPDMQLKMDLQEYRLKDKLIYILAGVFCCFFTPVVSFNEDYL
jgi:hypothetical protein